MSEFDAVAILDRLVAQRDKLRAVEASYAKLERNVMAAVQPKLDKARALRDEQAQPILDKIARLEERARAAVLEVGASVKTDGVQVQWTKPRVTWDSLMLEGMIAFHPEIAKARTISEPSTRIVYEKMKGD